MPTDEAQQSLAQPWQIQALGALRVAAEADLVPLARAGPRRLLAYLLLNHAAPLSRERLADALWPELSGAQGRRRLADALYRLRRELPPGALIVGGDLVSLHAELAIDLWCFERLVGRGTLDELRAAVAIYRGEVLPDTYDDWALGPRAAIHERFLAGLEQLAEAEADGVGAAALYRQLVAADPLRESAHVGLMRALARAERPLEALEAFAALERTLAHELDLPPGELACTLAARLREQLALSRQDDSARGQRLTRPPFVGRAAERAELLGRLEAARGGRGDVVLVVGESGIGKSRLAEELAAAALWHGWQLHWGRCEELAIAPPFAPLVAALAAALPTPRLQQLRHSVPAEALTLVEALLSPQLARPAPGGPMRRAPRRRR